jgi:hypothetical protein
MEGRHVVDVGSRLLRLIVQFENLVHHNSGSNISL